MKKEKLVFFVMDYNNFDRDSQEFLSQEFCETISEEEYNFEEISSYKQAKEKIVNWFGSMGYKAFEIKRNLEKYKILDIYHLDTFLNVVGDKLVVCKEAVQEDSMSDLKNIFGEENIIYLTEEERKMAISNFISFGSNILISFPLQSDQDKKTLVKKFNEKGVGVIIPAIYLGTTVGENGVRCRTQNIPHSILKKEIPDSKITKVLAACDLEERKSGVDRKY